MKPTRIDELRTLESHIRECEERLRKARPILQEAQMRVESLEFERETLTLWLRSSLRRGIELEQEPTDA